VDKKSVLFLCVSNTARSLMAEAILRRNGGDGFEVYSAGLRPGMAVAPETVAVLEEAGYDTEGLRSKAVDDYVGSLHPDFLITVCDSAERDCPSSWFMGAERLAWPIADPDAISGHGETRLRAFRDARDRLAARTNVWLSSFDARQ
jgi:arsenate reductase